MLFIYSSCLFLGFLLPSGNQSEQLKGESLINHSLYTIFTWCVMTERINA